jgi:hypothetical protein
MCSKTEIFQAACPREAALPKQKTMTSAAKRKDHTPKKQIPCMILVD